MLKRNRINDAHLNLHKYWLQKKTSIINPNFNLTCQSKFFIIDLYLISNYWLKTNKCFVLLDIPNTVCYKIFYQINILILSQSQRTEIPLVPWRRRWWSALISSPHRSLLTSSWAPWWTLREPRMGRRKQLSKLFTNKVKNCWKVFKSIFCVFENGIFGRN